MSELAVGALRLLVITPADRRPEQTQELVERALAGGATAVLLRERQLPAAARRSLARQLSSLCRGAGALLLVSNDLQLALDCAAHGVHLGHGGDTVASVRRQAPEMLVGRSAHWPLVDEDRAADYITLSPVAETFRSRPRPLLTSEQLSRAASDPGLGPLLALGGLNAARVRRLDRSIAGVAVLRALSQAADARTAAAELLNALEQRHGPDQNAVR